MKRGRLALLRRRGRLLAVVYDGRGLNLHRTGGVSLSGWPASGGTTVCWGKLRDRCEMIDAERPIEPLEPAGPNAWVKIVGPFMLRVGRDF